MRGLGCPVSCSYLSRRGRVAEDSNDAPGMSLGAAESGAGEIKVEAQLSEVRSRPHARRKFIHVGINLASGQHVAFFAKRARARSIEHRVREGVTACAGYPAVAC